MKQTLLFFLTSLMLLGCKDSANVKIVGYSNVQNDTGLLVVKVNGVKYAPDCIFTNMGNSRTGKETMRPVEGMTVTCFTMHSEPTVYFIAGEYDEEHIEEYFFGDQTGSVVALVLFIIAWIIFIFLAIVALKNQRNETTEKKG